MAAPGLTLARSRPIGHGLSGEWLRAYVAIWIATIGFTALTVLAGGALSLAVRQGLGLRLTADATPGPSIERVLALAAHNIPIAAWPLLLGVVGAHRHRLSTRIADTVLIACMLANIAPVGAALGAYGAALLPYLPQLPLEWAGLALGASAWLVGRRRTLTFRERLVWFVLIVCALLFAAVLETVAVPHR